MALKNYTTDVPVNKTVSEIHLMLADHGARKIMFNYLDDGKIEAVCFSIMTPCGERAIKLPANAQRVREVLQRQKRSSKARVNIDDTAEQSERVAWRIIKDWLSSQLAILETEMVEFEQVFLPYLVSRSGQTLYETYKCGNLLLPE